MRASRSAGPDAVAKETGAGSAVEAELALPRSGVTDARGAGSEKSDMEATIKKPQLETLRGLGIEKVFQ